MIFDISSKRSRIASQFDYFLNGEYSLTVLELVSMS